MKRRGFLKALGSLAAGLFAARRAAPETLFGRPVVWTDEIPSGLNQPLAEQIAADADLRLMEISVVPPPLHPMCRCTIIEHPGALKRDDVFATVRYDFIEDEAGVFNEAALADLPESRLPCLQTERGPDWLKQFVGGDGDP